MPGGEPGLDLLAVARRGDHEECWYHGACAVFEHGVGVVASYGDPELKAFLRSAAKPFQTIAVLRSGAGERYDLSPEDLALLSASHGGTEAHVDRVRSILKRAGLDEGALECGSHEPMDARSARALGGRSEGPTPVHNNCSGKHAGMLLAALSRGWDPRGYLEPEHPVQRQVRAVVAEYCEVEEAELGAAVDGCGVPTFVGPLSWVAKGYAALAAAGDDSEGSTVFDAMTTAPGMVAGPGRFTTELMETAGGRILAKEGAQGYYAMAVRGERDLGVAFKVADGSQACRDAVAVALLEQLGCLRPDERRRLQCFARPEIQNWSGRVVGEIEPCVELDLGSR